MTATGTEAILKERGLLYGSFTVHADVSQRIKRLFTDEMGDKWGDMQPDQRESLEMIAHKLARIINGNPDYGDSWRDIAGYATLVADRLEGPAASRRNETHNRLREILDNNPQSTTLEDGSTLTATGPVQNDPHAELRKTWKPGQRWQGRPVGSNGYVAWQDFDCPVWTPTWEYRRHPKDPNPKAPAEDASKQMWSDWRIWYGEAPNPLDGMTEVEVKFRSGRKNTGIVKEFNWIRAETHDPIVSYRKAV